MISYSMKKIWLFFFSYKDCTPIHQKAHVIDCLKCLDYQKKYTEKINRNRVTYFNEKSTHETQQMHQHLLQQ